jgi:hypothetical protein
MLLGGGPLTAFLEYGAVSEAYSGGPRHQVFAFVVVVGFRVEQRLLTPTGCIPESGLPA